MPNGGNGRNRGLRNHKHKVLERIAQSHSISLLESVISAAEAGDMVAAKIIFDRIWPRPRTAPISIDLPPTETAGEIRQAMHDLLARVAKGEITTDDGQALIIMMRHIIEANSVDMLTAQAGNGRIQNGNTRDLLAERLARVIEARRLQAPDGDAEESDSD